MSDIVDRLISEKLAKIPPMNRRIDISGWLSSILDNIYTEVDSKDLYEIIVDTIKRELAYDIADLLYDEIIPVLEKRGYSIE